MHCGSQTYHSGCGLFDEALPRSGDYDKWLRVACRGVEISYHQNPLGWMRPARLGSLGQSKIEMHEAGLHILNKLEKSRVPRPPARATAVTKAIARE
jgi:hypothetical protein